MARSSGATSGDAAVLLLSRSSVLLRQGSAEAALQCAQEGLAAARQSGDKADEISSLCACAEAFAATNQASQALTTAEEARGLAKAAADRPREAAAALVAAKAQLLSAESPQTGQVISEALAMARDLGLTWGELASLLSAAQAACRAAGAEVSARQRAAAARQGGDRWLECSELLAVALAVLSASTEEADKAALASVNEFVSLSQTLGVIWADAYDYTVVTRRLHGELSVQEATAKYSGDGGRPNPSSTLALAGAKLLYGASGEQVSEAEEALALFRKLGSKEGCAAALVEVSRSFLADDRPVEALGAAREAVSAFRELGQLPGESAAHSACALAHLSLGQRPEAASAAAAARAGLQERGLRRSSATALVTASRCFLAFGEVDRALQAGLEAAAAFQDVGDARGEAFALMQEVASVYLSKRETDNAAKVTAAALRLLRAAGDLHGEALALQLTIDIHLALGETEPAIRLVQEVISLCRDSGDVQGEVAAHGTAARVRLLRSEFHHAESAAQAALDLAKTQSDKFVEARARLCIAEVALAAKQDLGKDVAQQVLENALRARALFKELGGRQGQREALGVWIDIKVAAGEAKQAALAAREVAETHEAKAEKHCAADSQLKACRAFLAAAAADEAHKAATKARALWQELGYTKGEILALQAITESSRARCRPEDAMRAAVEVVSLYKRQGDCLGQAEATSALAKAYLAAAQPGEALSEVGEARVLFQKLESKQRSEALLLADTAVLAHLALDDSPKAVAVAEEASNLFRALGDRSGEAFALQACAKVCVQAGDLDSALKACRQAAAVLSRARSGAREEAEAHHVVAQVHLVRGEYHEAVASAAQALSLLRRPGDEGGRAAVLETASWAHSEELEPEAAVGAAEEAVALCRRTGQTPGLASALHAVAEAQLVALNFMGALASIEESLGLCRDKGDPGLEAHLLHAFAVTQLGRLRGSRRAAEQVDLRKDSLRAAKRSAELFAEQRSSDRRWEADSLWTLGKAHLEAGNLEAAAKAVQSSMESYIAQGERSGAAWAALLHASICLRSKGRAAGGQRSGLLGEEVTVPALDQAEMALLESHAVFRSAGDEDGQEAALEVLREIRVMRHGPAEGELRDTPRLRPLNLVTMLPPTKTSPYRALVGPRRLPWSTVFKLPKPVLVPVADPAGTDLKESAKNSEPDAATRLKGKDKGQASLPTRSALTSLDNWDKRFDRKVWHNIKATTSGLWEYPDLSKDEPGTIQSAEFVNGWLESLVSKQVSDA